MININSRLTIEWLTPEHLEFDPFLNEDANAGVVFYNDNLSVNVTGLNCSFDVSRRFLISVSEDLVSLSPEPDWNWNEHGELTSHETNILNLILEDSPELLNPPLTFHDQIRAAVRDKV